MTRFKSGIGNWESENVTKPHSYVGQPLSRREDLRFLTGRGRYVDDLRMPDAAYAAFVRSPHANAEIRGIDSEPARSMPGVLAVLTGDDWAAEGLGRSPSLWDLYSKDGQPMKEIRRPILAAGAVRHVGDTLALVVAETKYQALEAAEAVEVDYRPLPAISSTAGAVEPDAPVVHPEFGSNVAYDWEVGDEKAVAAAFARAAHVTTLDLINNRVAPSPMEPRAVCGNYDPSIDHYTLWTTTQNPHLVRRWLAEESLFVPEHKIRVIAPDVGGGFGQKIYHYPEEPTVLWASKIVGRPVRWTATRSETFMVDTHARDHVTHCEMAFDKDGRILAVRADTIAALGAYISPFGACIPTFCYAPMLSGPYTMSAIHCRVRGVYTNTTPVDAYRGAGRPEYAYVVERLVENGAREMGIDVRDLRSRNFIMPAAFPYTTPTNVTYDSGNFPGLVAELDNLVTYDELRAEQKRLRAKGQLMGIGLAAFLDSAGSGPSKIIARNGAKMGGWDVANIRVHPTGKVSVFCGSHSHGQGHATTYAQILADRLGCDIGEIDIVEGDTDRIPYGLGTMASRSLTIVGSAIELASRKIIAKGAQLAAHLLECAQGDIVFEKGAFVVAGTDKTLSFAKIAHAAYSGADYPAGFELGLEAQAVFDPDSFNFPSGLQLCVVMVDRETGTIKIREHYSIDDAGLIINPKIVKGQVHGGLVQGIGQAMMEGCVYDDQSGQLLTGSFMDYSMPRASDLPSFMLGAQETLSPTNPLGVKGIGETGTIGAPAAVANAVVDALWHLGVRHIDMPLTPSRVWQAIRAATKSAEVERIVARV
ncbi:MAG: aerobic carbon-monoxide dehydrogenase large subunit [Rhodospirillaceae bacterium]|jgi:carbon-monoxide dehydrogenase large subunit|nr:aerobic carbon-monoxide dehydrogenase large subunit [Rhodospirillaceae bacterium]